MGHTAATLHPWCWVWIIWWWMKCCKPSCFVLDGFKLHNRCWSWTLSLRLFHHTPDDGARALMWVKRTVACQPLTCSCSHSIYMVYVDFQIKMLSVVQNSWSTGQKWHLTSNMFQIPSRNLMVLERYHYNDLHKILQNHWMYLQTNSSVFSLTNTPQHQDLDYILSALLNRSCHLPAWNSHSEPMSVTE